MLCRTVARTFSVRGFYVCARGLDIPKIDKTPLIYNYISIWRAKPTEALRGDGTVLMFAETAEYQIKIN